MKTGGQYNASKIAGIANAADIGLYGGTMLEGTIGSVASAHVFSTFTNLNWGTELFGPLLLTDDIVVNPMVYRDCTLEVPKNLDSDSKSTKTNSSFIKESRKLEDGSPKTEKQNQTFQTNSNQIKRKINGIRSRNGR